MIRSPPPSFVPRSNLLSVQTLSQSSPLQSQQHPSTRNVKLFCLILRLLHQNHKHWLHPPFHQDFSSSIQKTSDHKPSAKPNKLIYQPTSASSLTGTPQSSQLKFQLPTSIPIPLVSTVAPPYTPTFPSCPTPTAHFSFSTPPSTSYHHLVPHPPSKVLPATPGSSLHVEQHVTEEVQISPPAVPHVACGLIHLNLLAKTTTKLFLVGIPFLHFYATLNFYLVFCIFLGKFLTLCMKTCCII